MSSSETNADRDQLAARERELAALRSEVAAWRARFGKLPMRDDTDFTSVSGRSVEPVYTPLDLSPDLLGQGVLPGQFPYTRGIHPSGYRGKLWTMRQFAGFGTAQDTNERYKFLLSPRPDRPFRGLRLPDADGLRRRPPALRG